MKISKTTIIEYGKIALGSIIFAFALNIFIVPFGLYNGGIIGTAQIIRTLLSEWFNINFSFDIAGIINMLLNVPLLIAAYFVLNLNFVKKTIFSVAVQTVAFSVIPILEEPLLADRLASVILGGIISGIGVGMVLVQKGCAGGNDTTSMLLMKNNPSMSVGKFNLYYNIGVYVACALLFNLEVTIYSVLQAVIFSFVVDKQHLQNIEVSVTIFTRNKEIKKMIINEQHRGVTYWKGKGAYTDNDVEVLVSIVSKAEVGVIERKVKDMDPNAFVIVSNQAEVIGNVEKRLI